MNKIFSIVLIACLLITSCVKRYDPYIKSKDAMKYVIMGGVYSGDTVQRIKISKTSRLSDPKVVPVFFCNVKIIDGKGNEYPAKDLDDGNYEVKIPQSELATGSIFKVDVHVPGGAHIVSDFDSIQDCPEVDSVYYILEEQPTSNPYFPIRGIRFYVDMNAKNFSCRTYKFEAVETWEYTAIFAIDKDHSTCWLTYNVKNIYDVSTKDQTENVYKHLPLHFVDNFSSQRLRYMYSLLVSQMSLSAAAYNFWEKMRINSADQGGLYESQPVQIQGNLHNISDPTQQVLGYFGASGKKSKRIFVSDIPGLSIEFLDCKPAVWPEILNAECEDCTAQPGGTNQKPAYWPR
jgi:hypothetical protein